MAVCICVSVCCCTQFCYPDNKRRFHICTVSPSRQEWKAFLYDGFTLLANSYLASVSTFIQPIVTARLGGGGGTAGAAALGARTILSQVGNYPQVVAGVVGQVVTILGSKYIGQNTPESITTYLKFARNILVRTELILQTLKRNA